MVRDATPGDALAYIVAGSQVVVRDEEWLIRSTQETPADGRLVRCMGISTLVRDTEATFLTSLDRIEPLRPDDTAFIPDDSPGFRRSRLYLEAVLRKTPIPANRNPFTVFRWAIISIDPVKNAGRYRHHLEGVHWAAVVIDECRNLVNKGTLNNQRPGSWLRALMPFC